MGRSASPRRSPLTPPRSGGPKAAERSRSRSRVAGRAGADETGIRTPERAASPAGGGGKGPGGPAKVKRDPVQEAARKAAKAAKKKRARAAKAQKKDAGKGPAKAAAPGGPETGGAEGPPQRAVPARAEPRTGAARKVGRAKSASPQTRRQVGIGGAENLQMDRNATIAGLSPLRWPGTDHREQLKAEAGKGRAHAPSPAADRRDDPRRPSPSGGKSPSLERRREKGKRDKGKGKGSKGRKRSRSKGGGKGKDGKRGAKGDRAPRPP